ncbi:ribosome-associated heat shock protein implicated in the recycling of the 50S subunit [Roseibium sp. TrichSKD4]|nr:ribosome-associated heat shock protein implicated in the recycling of the 50S subunit [Roseibium sp. TrichSKD4]
MTWISLEDFCFALVIQLGPVPRLEQVRQCHQIRFDLKKTEHFGRFSFSTSLAGNLAYNPHPNGRKSS